MATIRTAIELQDNFTGILHSVINSVNLGLSAMEDLHQTMNASVDMTSIQTARDSINQATIAVRQLDAAMQRIGTSQTPTVPQNSALVNIPTLQPTTWKSYDAPEVFTGTEIERFQQEIASVNSMLQDLNNTQGKITQMANETDVLSPQAQYDVEMIENRMNALRRSIQQVEQNPLNIGSDSANASLEQLRTRLSQLLESQENLNSAMQGGDVSAINSAYLQISQNISNAERMVRDSFENIPPTRIPITWQSDSLEVFTNSGIERFEQEVQSTNNMLNTLNQTQSRIAQRAARTDLLPQNAVADMNNMQSRLQAIQQRIQAIENNPMNIGTDTANAELEWLRGQLNQAVQEQQNLNQAINNMDARAANAAYLKLSQTVSSTESHIRDNVDEQGRFNREIEEGVTHADNLMGSIKKYVAAYATMQTAGKVIELSDTMTQTTARLNLIVDSDDNGGVEELQSKIFASAQASRGSYLATADAVSKLGMQASQAFNSNDELIAFTELLNKQFVNAGTSAQGIDSVMLQLTQSMSAGRLQGEELNAVMDNASIIVQDIQRYLQEVEGIDASNIKKLAADGVITANIIKNAMFYTARETNEKFESMPMTFGQIWQSFKNTALMAFQPVLQRMNEIANSETFQGFVNSAIEALSTVAGIALEIFDLLVGVASAIADNWSWISPIIYGVAGALAVYYGWLLLTKGAEMAMAAVHGIVAVAKGIMAAATMLLTGATWAETTAQYGLNAAMYACPIVWIIILIIALIAIFYAVIAAINKFAGTSISATGVICGIFMFALAVIGNILITLWNLVVDVFALIYNLVASVANFIGNVFDDPIGAVCRLFFDLADTVLGVLETLASAVDTIFGSNLAGTIQGWRDSLGGWVDDTFGKGNEVMEKMNAEDMKFKRFEYGKAWEIGYSFGAGLGKQAKEDESPVEDTFLNQNGYGGGAGGIGDNINDIANNTENIADSMEITEEDLKYLRDIAEQETINRFTTAEIVIEQTNHNTVSGKMDLDGIVSGLTDAANEAVFMIAEGVHI